MKNLELQGAGPKRKRRFGAAPLDGVMMLLKTKIQSVLLPQLVNLSKHGLGECGDELRIRRQEIPQTPSSVWDAAISSKVVVRCGKSALGKKLSDGSLPLCL